MYKLSLNKKDGLWFGENVSKSTMFEESESFSESWWQYEVVVHIACPHCPPVAGLRSNPAFGGWCLLPSSSTPGIKNKREISRERELGSKGLTTLTPFLEPPKKMPLCLNKEFLSCIKTKASVQKQLENRNPCTLECYTALKTSL